LDHQRVCRLAAAREWSRRLAAAVNLYTAVKFFPRGYCAIRGFTRLRRACPEDTDTPNRAFESRATKGGVSSAREHRRARFSKGLIEWGLNLMLRFRHRLFIASATCSCSRLDYVKSMSIRQAQPVGSPSPTMRSRRRFLHRWRRAGMSPEVAEVCRKRKRAWRRLLMQMGCNFGQGKLFSDHPWKMKQALEPF